MVKHKLSSFANISFVDSCNFTNKTNSCTPYVKIDTRPNLCHFDRRLFLSKKCRPGYRAVAYIWENFHPIYRDLGRKNWDLGNWCSTVFHVNTSNFWQKKKEWPCEISETEPSRLYGLIWRGPNSVSMRKSIKPIEHKSPISLELGTTSDLGRLMIVAKKYVQIFNSPQVRATPCRSGNLTQSYAYLTCQVCFSVSKSRKAL